MRYLWLAFAILVAFIGAAVGRLLKLLPPAALTVIMVPMFLALFPFMKRWMPEATFAYWATAAAISTAVAWLLYLGFSRFGG
jgi:predicted branched-subunit amino acid permease